MQQQARHDSPEQLRQSEENEERPNEINDPSCGCEGASEDKKLDGPNRPST